MPTRETRRSAERPAAERAVVAAPTRPGSLSGFTSSRARIVRSARTQACAAGYQSLSATTVIAAARVSSKTFYANFAGVEHCFIAAYDEAIEEIAGAMRPAYMRPGPWVERVRAALAALLALLERDPELARLVFVEAPKARDLLGTRRNRILEVLQLALDGGRAVEHAAIPPLADELVVEGVISIIRARVAAREPHELPGLLDELLRVITHAYLGAAVDGAQLARMRAAGLPPGGVVLEPPEARLRITYRTLRVLTAVAARPGSSNRELSEAAGVKDQGQISKLLRRLEAQGLIRNQGVDRNGVAKRWELTEQGLRLQRRAERDLERLPARSWHTETLRAPNTPGTSLTSP